MKNEIEVLRGLVVQVRAIAEHPHAGSPSSKAKRLNDLADKFDAALAALSVQAEVQAGGEDAVERVAAEICRHDSTSPFWADLSEQFKPRYRDMARAAIAAVATTPPPGSVPEGMVRVEVAVVSELMDALHSFAATAEDDESYTVSSELMSRLAMLGAVYRAKRVGWYYLTDFGRMLLAAAPGPKE